MSQRPLRVLFDTSVLLSIAGRPTGNYVTWKAVVAGDLLAVASQDSLDELRDVLTRPKIRQHYGAALDPSNVDRFIAGYKAIALFLSPPPLRFVLHADPKDSFLFNLAIEAKVDFLITFDEAHLLAVNRPEHPQHDELRALAPQLRIVKPGELVSHLSSK